MTNYFQSVEINPKNQNDNKLIVNECSNESYGTQSQIGQTALVQERTSKETKELTGEANEDKNRTFDFKDNNDNFLADKIELSKKETRKQKQKVILTRFSKADTVRKRLNEALKKHPELIF